MNREREMEVIEQNRTLVDKGPEVAEQNIDGYGRLL
jgi:hypothetical protein